MLQLVLLRVALAATLPTALPASGPLEAPHFRLEAPADGVSPRALLQLTESRAEVTVVGGLADVHILQSWVNVSKRTMSADYIFPAPTRAAVTGMTLQIGERVIRADIKERADAQRTFDTALRTGQTAALLEEERPNVFRMRVGNIQPDDVIDVALNYSERLRIVDGEYEVVVPRAVAARYGGEISPARAQAMTHQNPLAGDRNHGHRWAVDVLLQTPLALSHVRSTSHPVQPDFRSRTEAWVRVSSDGSGAPPMADFVLRFSLLQDAIAQGVALYRDPEHGENYFMMTLAPPKRIASKQISAREIIFVVDVSGSMRGEPTEIVNHTMDRLLQDLNPRDRFNVMTFAGDAAMWQKQSAPATPANCAAAQQFLARRTGGGGTELENAIRRAEGLPGNRADVARSIVLITDGHISADQALVHRIHTHRNDYALFAMGIGSTPTVISSRAWPGRAAPNRSSPPTSTKRRRSPSALRPSRPGPRSPTSRSTLTGLMPMTLHRLRSVIFTPTGPSSCSVSTAAPAPGKFISAATREAKPTRASSR